VNLVTTNGTQAAIVASASSWLTPRLHGWVSAVFIGLLMPLAMILARNFKVR